MPPRRAPTDQQNGMQEFIAAMQGFFQQQAQGAQNPQRNNTSVVVEQFRRYNPPRFDGRSGPLAMEEWIRELERIFEHIECTDAHKVSCAVFQFCEDASHWWESFKRSMTEQARQGLTWNRFKEIVTNQYFPRSYRNQKEVEFLDLKQGELSITDYERKFNQLSRYATRLVNTNDQKADRFLRGLRPEIRGILAAQGIEDYALAVRRAQEVEAGLEMDKLPRKNMVRNEKRKWEDSNDGEKDMQNKKERVENKSNEAPQRTYPQCPECNKYHLGKCMIRSGVCYFCHKPGHIAPYCPDKRGREPERRGNARLYHMGGPDEAEKP
ncbi:uncharacterized protein LOC131025719 [Salvia miltiorrhiza]|uniref:uncharacterized protein LOC131025719 n=1 Tax=Salvia miltiorrhiza TaxID=226208 RepID=UPI0025ABE3E3|nr:uncharacterized protein LOC131025719 [Salvia miltiorrhiza]